MRWAEHGMSPRRAALLGVLILAIATYFIFTKALPFQHHFQVRAVVESSNLLEPGSPVRIGGDTIGKVTGTGRYRNTNLAVVDMEIDSDTREIHRDATIWIRPRLFLEGNFYVALSPGTPEAPPMPDGGTIPVDHTQTPVQLDQVLDTLTSGIRGNLQQALAGIGTALDTKPTAAQALHLNPLVRNLTGAEAINHTFTTGPASLRDTAMTSQALTGEDGSALSRVVSGFAHAAAGLGRANAQLGPMIDDLDTTLQATASQQQSLREVVAQIGPTAQNAETAFTALSSAFPETERISDDLAQAIPQLPATITAAYPWLSQAAPLLTQPELLGLLEKLQPASGDLAMLTNDELQFLPDINAFDLCMTKVFIPTGDVVVNDGSLSSGAPNYREFFYAMTAMAGASQGEDGNGNFLRLAASGGPYTVESGQTNYFGNVDTGFASMAAKPLRTRPYYPNAVPQLQRKVACDTQPVPDVNGTDSTGAADGSDPNGAAPARPDDPSENTP